MADLMNPLASVLATVWHIGAWGLGLTLGVLWAWELSASRQQAKAEKNVQEWYSEERVSSQDRFEYSSTDLPRSAKMSSDILSRISPHAAPQHRN